MPRAGSQSGSRRLTFSGRNRALGARRTDPNLGAVNAVALWRFIMSDVGARGPERSDSLSVLALPRPSPHVHSARCMPSRGGRCAPTWRKVVGARVARLLQGSQRRPRVAHGVLASSTPTAHCPRHHVRQRDWCRRSRGAGGGQGVPAEDESGVTRHRGTGDHGGGDGSTGGCGDRKTFRCNRFGAEHTNPGQEILPRQILPRQGCWVGPGLHDGQGRDTDHEVDIGEGRSCEVNFCAGDTGQGHLGQGHPDGEVGCIGKGCLIGQDRGTHEGRGTSQDCGTHEGRGTGQDCGTHEGRGTSQDRGTGEDLDTCEDRGTSQGGCAREGRGAGEDGRCTG